MGVRDPGHRRFTAGVLAAALGLWLLAVWQIERAPLGETLPAWLASAVSLARVGGGGIAREGGAWVAALRVPILLVAVLAATLAEVARRRRPGGAPARASAAACVQLAACLALAWIGQSFWMDGRLVGGGLLYALAGLGVLLRAEPAARPQPEEPRAPPSGLEGAAIGACLGAFVLLCVDRIDVFPDIYFDEIAYYTASRMQLGELERDAILGRWGWSGYSYDLFRSQALALAAHTGATALLGPGIAALRVVSIGSFVLALATVTLVLRRRAGAGIGLATLFLASFAPLCLGYARNGQYMALSVLHGALGFAVLVRFRETPTGARAALLGGLLGASLYLYQLSWFVPVLVGACLAASPELWRRRRFAGPAAVLAASTLAMATPSLVLFEHGLRSVAAQTFDRAVWEEPWETRPSLRRELAQAVLRAPPELPRERGLDFAQRFASPELRVAPLHDADAPLSVHLMGNRAQTERAVAAARADHWRIFADTTRAEPGAGSRTRSMLETLAFAPGWESAERWIEAPLLDPVVVPLIALGLLVALRRSRDFLWRYVALWSAIAAVLPATVAATVPRRALLAVPLLFALAALPLAELWRLAPSIAARRVVAAGLALLFGVVALVGIHTYFDRWDLRFTERPEASSLLEFVRAVESLPAGDAVLAPELFRGVPPGIVLRVVQESDRPLREVPGAYRLDTLRRVSCETPPPFSWVTPDTPQQRRLFASLRPAFAIETRTLGNFRVARIESLPERVCRRVLRPARPGA